jgi:hypothetical protein
MPTIDAKWYKSSPKLVLACLHDAWFSFQNLSKIFVTSNLAVYV